MEKKNEVMAKSVKRLNNVKGFTLLELIVVLAILAALAALAIPRFGGILEKSQKSADESNVRIMESALEVYRMESDTDDYPAGNDFDAMVTELHGSGYLKSGNIKPAFKGHVFKYNNGVVTVE